jgi:pimeloyl-ACP methyl ester carboxylesterase
MSSSLAKRSPRVEAYSRDGLTFEVTDAGPEDGRVVIMLHGFPEDRHEWLALSEPLVRAGYRVLAPDQRGYSPKARPSGRRAYAIEELTADVLALADAVGTARFDVVGHDWGAAVAWALAARHKDRVSSLCALSVPHPGAFLRSLARSSQLLHSWYMLFFQIPALPERAVRFRMADTLARTGLDRDTAERFAQRARDPRALTGPINWYRALPFSARRPLPPVEVPVLFVWGDKERFVTRAAAEGCARFCAGPYRFVALSGQTHWLPTTVASEVAPLLLEHLASVKD